MSWPETTGVPPVVRTVSDLRRYVDTWHKAGETVVLVPTMGALHLGHLALVERASRTCTRTIVSLFVNPTQFGPGEDFGSYPRDEAGDAGKLEAARCDLLFAPTLAEMYPNGYATTVISVKRTTSSSRSFARSCGTLAFVHGSKVSRRCASRTGSPFRPGTSI